MRIRSFHFTESLHQRVYHNEPYPTTLNPTYSVPPSPTELCLPPFNLPTSPKHRRSLLSTGLPGFPESPTFWLVMYFSFNLGLTLYNKGVLVRFPFPYTLSALHALFGTIGGSILAKRRTFIPSRLNPREMVVLVAFSVLYAINIVVSNVSLQLVTVPFHQVVRAATPIFTIVFSALLFGSQCSRTKKMSLIPVVMGVGLATFGDYYFTRAGFLLTLLGTVLAAFKTILTNVLQTPTSPPTPSEKSTLIFPSVFQRPYFSNPLDLLFFLSPFAFIQCIFLAYSTGELARVSHYSSREMSSLKAIALFLNGFIAFGLNVVSFSANRRVGALGMTVAANVKQVLTIVCAVFIFNLTITALNGLGIVLTLAGGTWYAWIELAEKQNKT
ncbi:triose-phosphate transporter family-domain-containing protein [Mycena sp. CBHHK59/15]|nr:triose-phosphate transporter family-domain-containing protein [Mycena sp. CBHHK59/15]